MEEERTIPFIAHESEVSRLERVIKRLWILCIVIFVALIGTNAGWIYYENRYEDIVVTQDIDTGTGIFAPCSSKTASDASPARRATTSKRRGTIS